MSNKTIVRTVFGSQLYGTNLPSSDEDYKSIFIPDGNDILLLRPAKVIKGGTKKDNSRKNEAGDVDDDQHSVSHFLHDLMDGQTWATDILFTPEKLYKFGYDNPFWQEILKNKDHFLSKNISGFVGYCKTQAMKYSGKGQRLQAIELVVEFLKSQAGHKKLFETDVDLFIKKASESGYGDLVEKMNLSHKNGSKEDYLSVCNLKVGYHTSVSLALEIYSNRLKAYGDRVRASADSNCADWKSIYHAIRVAREAEELLLTGNITFPRPEKELLLQIRLGQLSMEKAQDLIEEGLARVETAQDKSTLRNKPNHKFAERLLVDIHLHAVTESRKEK